MPTLKHLHTYKRMKRRHPNAPLYYRCIHPSCTHKIESEMLDGKKANCPHCNSEYMIGRYELMLKLPHCVACGNPRTEKGKERKELAARTREFQEKLQKEFNSVTAEPMGNLSQEEFSFKLNLQKILNNQELL